jgi:amino-acid N-acetyltransferase
MYSIRPATASDSAAIRQLIHDVRIYPIGLDWQRFLLAVTPEGELIGCGQIKPHGDGTRELASIAVVPAWRGRGVARTLIERLLADHPRVLYLTCMASNGPLYEKFGFRSIGPDEMPPYFRRLARLASTFRALHLSTEAMLVMKRDSGNTM